MRPLAASPDVYGNAIHIQSHLNSRFASKHGHSLGVVPAKPLKDAQPTTNREQCQTCLNIAEVRRRKRCGS